MERDTTVTAVPVRCLAVVGQLTVLLDDDNGARCIAGTACFHQSAASDLLTVYAAPSASPEQAAARVYRLQTIVCGDGARCVVQTAAPHALSVVLYRGAVLTLPNAARFDSLRVFLHTGSELRSSGVTHVQELAVHSDGSEGTACSGLMVHGSLTAEPSVHGSVQYTHDCVVHSAGSLQVLAVHSRLSHASSTTRALCGGVFADVCCVCQQQPGTYVAADCRHALLCHQCDAVHRLLGTPCPKCRRPVRAIGGPRDFTAISTDPTGLSGAA